MFFKSYGVSFESGELLFNIQLGFSFFLLALDLFEKVCFMFCFLILRNEDSWTLVSLIIAISLFQGVIFFFFILFCYFFVLACEE